LFESEICINAAVLLVDRPNVRTAREFVQAFAEATPAEVIRGIFEYSHREPELADLIDRAIEGDEAALTALEDTMPAHKRHARLEILRQPNETLTAMVDVLSAWADLFSPIEPRVTEILERDYDARASDRATLAPVDLIERTTAGIRWLPEAGVRRVVLAPSYFSRPYNFIMSAGDWRLFGYPVADSAIEPRDPLAAPQAVVRLHRAPEAPGHARPVPHRNRAAARALQADDQAPSRTASIGRARDDHGVRNGRLLLTPPRSARRRLGGHQAVPHRLAASLASAVTGRGRTRPTFRGTS
jgi:hypothetical protein